MTVTEEETVKVLAPSNLSEGYVLDVTVDGKTFAVTVPPGGVKEGDYFDGIIASPSASTPLEDPEIMIPASSAVAAVPITGDAAIATSKTIVQNPDGTQTVTEETTHPDGTTTKTVTSIAAASAAGPLKPSSQAATPGATVEAPTGAWRHGLFECCDVCGNGMFWMSLCCPFIAMGQLLQRLKLNLCGQPGGDYKNTCLAWTIVYAVSQALYWIIVSATQGYGIVLYYALAIVSLVAMTQARHFMRKKWSLPADCCDDSGGLSDCCCVFWCSCCSVIQMMRHTHDEKVHHYNLASKTGLDEGAPEVV